MNAKLMTLLSGVLFLTIILVTAYQPVGAAPPARTRGDRAVPGDQPGTEGLMKAVSRPVSPSQVWGEHWLDCPLCILGDRPSEDRLCDEGRQLRDAAVADIEQRLKDFTWEAP